MRFQILLLLLAACGPNPAASPFDFQTCDPAESPQELLRLEGTHPSFPVAVYDVGDAVSVQYVLESDIEPGVTRPPPTYSLVDNCGGAPLRLPDTLGLSSGAANVGGEVVLCGSDEPLEPENKGVWELLEDGSRGEDLGLGDYCSRDLSSLSGTRDPSFGIVYDPSNGAVSQFLPDGTERLVGGGFEFVSTPEGAAVFTFGENAAIHPPDGSAPIELGLPEAVFSVYPAPGGPASSGWILALPRGKPSGGERPDQFPPVVGYAIELSTGAWFQTPELVLELRDTSTLFSLHDGLLATNGGFGIEFSRAGWKEHLSLGRDATVFAVLDADRVFLVGNDEVQVIEVPRDLPEVGADFEAEVLWSRPRGADEQPLRRAGFVWNGLVLTEHAAGTGVPFSESSTELWAYPQDGRPAFSFVPSSSLLYFGPQTVIGLGFRPGSEDDAVWLWQRSVDGEFEVIADNLASGESRPGGLGHAWTPELGRILYSVRDSDAVSIRQHLISQ